jgi:hypothetical protein
MWKLLRTRLNTHQPYRLTKPRVTSARNPWSTGLFMQLSQMCHGQGGTMSYVVPPDRAVTMEVA